jgi:hypothetical protein
MILKNDILQLVLFATALLSGLISGQMLAIALANWAARDLPELSWTLRFQVENKLFTKTMPPSLMAPTAGTIGTLFFFAESCVLVYGRIRLLYGRRSCNNFGMQCAH